MPASLMHPVKTDLSAVQVQIDGVFCVLSIEAMSHGRLVISRGERSSGEYERILFSRSVKLVDSFTKIWKGAASFLIATWTSHWIEENSMR